jgi:hypothetical protein
MTWNGHLAGSTGHLYMNNACQGLNMSCLHLHAKFHAWPCIGPHLVRHNTIEQQKSAITLFPMTTPPNACRGGRPQRTAHGIILHSRSNLPSAAQEKHVAIQRATDITPCIHQPAVRACAALHAGIGCLCMLSARVLHTFHISNRSPYDMDRAPAAQQSSVLPSMYTRSLATPLSIHSYTNTPPTRKHPRQTAQSPAHGRRHLLLLLLLLWMCYCRACFWRQ